MPVSSKQAIKKMEKDGWKKVGVTGSHHHFKKGDNSVKVTVPHPKKELSPGVARDIERKTGLKL